MSMQLHERASACAWRLAFTNACASVTNCCDQVHVQFLGDAHLQRHLHVFASQAKCAAHSLARGWMQAQPPRHFQTQAQL